jgi:flavorubredoxin
MMGDWPLTHARWDGEALTEILNQICEAQKVAVGMPTQIAVNIWREHMPVR